MSSPISEARVDLMAAINEATEIDSVYLWPDSIDKFPAIVVNPATPYLTSGTTEPSATVHIDVHVLTRYEDGLAAHEEIVWTVANIPEWAVDSIPAPARPSDRQELLATTIHLSAEVE